MTDNNELGMTLSGIDAIKQILKEDITPEEKVNRINEHLGEDSKIKVAIIGTVGPMSDEGALTRKLIELGENAKNVIVLASPEDIDKLTEEQLLLIPKREMPVFKFTSPPIMEYDRDFSDELFKPKKGKNSWKSPYKYHG